MPCYHPLTGIIDGEKRTASGKPLIRIVPAEVAACIQDQSSIVKLPCGQCIGCRLDYSREWANRLILELQDHDPDDCWFVTLTYDNDHIVDLCRSEKGFYSLNKRDLQLFMKRLRRSIEPAKVRFYAVGEYGGHTLRPHFHLILFNAPLAQWSMEQLHKSAIGYVYQSSELLNGLWPFGYNVCAPVTWESCAYTARYMLKKLKGKESDFYDSEGLERPFATMSRKPGIGKSYFDSMENFAESTFICAPAGNGVKQFPPPAYFERQFEQIDPEASANRKALKKSIAIERRQLELQLTDLDEEAYLAVKEIQFKRKLKSLDVSRTI